MLTHFHFPSTSLSLISGPSHAHTHTHCRLSEQLADLCSLFRPQIPFTRGVWSPKAGGALLPVHVLAAPGKHHFHTVYEEPCPCHHSIYTAQFWRAGNESCLLLYSQCLVLCLAIVGVQKANVAWTHEIAYLRHLISKKKGMLSILQSKSESISFFKTRFYN